MSFANRLRSELAAIAVKSNCCRRALAEGLLLGASVDGQTKTVVSRFGNKESAELAEEIFWRQFGKRPDVNAFGKCGHSYWDLSLSSPSCLKYMRTLDAKEIVAEETFHCGCDACRHVFLRGAFLALGTVNDPHKSFHLEFKISDVRAEKLASVLADMGYPPRSIAREEYMGLYYKDGSSIEELITLMGAGHVLFEIINSRIERDIRNNENRATNCVARNIEKTIAAATKQIEAINKLMESGKLESLPEGLQQTARQRYANPDASLDELVSIHVPSISKSGLNHRLKKLMDEADVL